MVKLRRILCPIDFSALSRRALDHAAALARLHQAEVTCLHVAPFVTVGLLPPEAGPGVASPDLTPELEAQFVSFVQPARRRGVTLSAVVVPGDPACSIISAAKALPADRVIMGTHGRQGLGRLLLGSERVLQKVRCPVFGVASAPDALRRILCAVDLSNTSLAAVRYGVSLAAAAPGCSLTLIHVRSPLRVPGSRGPEGVEVPGYQGYIERSLLRRMAEAEVAGIPSPVRPEVSVVSGTPSCELLSAARDRQADLIVAGKAPHRLPHRLFSGFTVRRLIREAPCPVLAVDARPQGAEGGHDEDRQAA